MKKIRITIDNIDAAINELENYKKELKLKQELLMQKLAARGYQLVTEKLDSMDMPYSKNGLISDTRVEYGEKYARIINESDHAFYVEFGTGVYGADVNGHGETGWIYYSDGEFHWTKGMQSRPFMHESFEQLCDEVISISKEVFK